MKIDSSPIGVSSQAERGLENGDICPDESQNSRSGQLQANSSVIINFYSNRSILITGGSGFIGKVLVEKLLRSCSGIERIFVLIRPKWNKKPHERMRELLKLPLFDGLRQRGIDLEQRVHLVEGDVTKTQLGLSERDLARIIKEVSVIIHSAATIKFDEPLKKAVEINVVGVKNMIEVCRRIPKLAALVHVSTAYANCDRQDEIEEHIYPVSGLDPEQLMGLASWMDQDTMQVLKPKLLGARPNTYTYTKALAEWLLAESARDLPVVICRPSIVVASHKEPFPGWIDNCNGPTGILLGAGKGLVRTMLAELSFVADVVPVDSVVNMIIALGWFASIYQHSKPLLSAQDSCSSRAESLLGSDCADVEESLDDSSDALVDSNLAMLRQKLYGGLILHEKSHLRRSESFRLGPSAPYAGRRAGDSLSSTNTGSSENGGFCRGAFELTLDQFRHDTELKLTAKGLPQELADVPVFHCVTGAENPVTWTQIQVLTLPALLIYPSLNIYRCPVGVFTGSLALDFFYHCCLHLIPAYIIDFLLRLLGRKAKLVNIYRKYEQAAQVFRPFTTREWKFKPKHRSFLFNQLLSAEDRSSFDCELTLINWPEFFQNYVLGVRKYILGEPNDTLPQARINQNYIYYRNSALQILSIALIAYLLLAF